MEIEEWKTMVLKAHQEARFTVDAETGHAVAVVGEGLTLKTVGTFSPDGVVWFLGKRSLQ